MNVSWDSLAVPVLDLKVFIRSKRRQWRTCECDGGRPFAFYCDVTGMAQARVLRKVFTGYAWRARLIRENLARRISAVQLPRDSNSVLVAGSDFYQTSIPDTQRLNEIIHATERYLCSLNPDRSRPPLSSLLSYHGCNPLLSTL